MKARQVCSPFFAIAALVFVAAGFSPDDDHRSISGSGSSRRSKSPRRSDKASSTSSPPGDNENYSSITGGSDGELVQVLTTSSSAGPDSITTTVVFAINSSAVPTNFTKDVNVDEEPRCVNIPDNLTSCRSLLGYRQMRTPDLLRTALFSRSDGRLASAGRRDVITDWIDGLMTSEVTAKDVPSCSSAAGLFVCTLLSPVCLERPVWPCRSLCERIRRDCGGGDNGVTCDWLPTDEQLCIGRDGTADNMSALVDAAAGESISAMTSSSRGTVGDVIGADRANAWRLLHAADEANFVGSRRPICVHPDCVQATAASDILLDNFCAADFVAKIRPDRYITSTSDVKIIATKSIKFYKFPSTWSSPDSSFSPHPLSNARSKWIFHIGRDLITNCSCHSRYQTAATESEADRSTSGGGNFVIVGRLERNGNRGGRRAEHHPKTRLELTAIAPFDSQLKDFRRALRAIKATDACSKSAVRQLVATGTGNHRVTMEKTIWRAEDKTRSALADDEINAKSRKNAWRFEKKLRRRAEKIRAARKGSKKSARMQKLESLTEVRDVTGDNERVQPRRWQSATAQVDEKTIRANRRDRIEMRKVTANQRP